MQKDQKEEWQKRMNDLEDKSQYYTLALFTFIIILLSLLRKRKEKKELKKLHHRNTEIKLKSLEEERKRKEEEERKRQEEERERQKKKKEIFKRQLQLRKEQKLNQSKKVATDEEKVKEVLEDMCVLGSIMKEEIREEKQKNPEKFISIEEATKKEKKMIALFV